MRSTAALSVLAAMPAHTVAAEPTPRAWPLRGAALHAAHFLVSLISVAAFCWLMVVVAILSSTP